MIMLLYFCLLFAILPPNIITQGPDAAGPVGTFVLTYAKKCDSMGDQKVKLKLDLKNIDNGKKSFNINLELPEDVDETYQLYLNIDKWNQGAWANNFYKTNGGLLELMDKYIPKVYENVLKKLSPTFDKGENKIPAGKYELKDFQDVEDSISLPKIFYGKLRMTFDILNKSGESVLCVEVGAQSDE